MRVGLRRLRSALLAFRDLVPKKAAKPIAGACARLMPPLGAARDWDVFCEGLVRSGTQEPERAARCAAAGARAAQARERAACARARLRARRELQRFLLRALRWVNERPWKASAEGVLARRLRRSGARAAASQGAARSA